MLTQLPPEISNQQMKLVVLQLLFCLLKETVQNPVPSSIAVVNHAKVDSSLF